VATGGALLLFLLATTLLLLRTAHADRVYPAVVVADVSVGGLSTAQAANALQGRATAIENSTASFSHDGKEWQAALRDIGLTVDHESGLAEALAAAASRAWEPRRDSVRWVCSLSPRRELDRTLTCASTTRRTLYSMVGHC
jgi:hypothetical protein